MFLGSACFKPPLGAFGAALLIACAACASGSGAPEDSVARRPAPDWLATGGKSPRFPVERFLAGFAMVEVAPGQPAAGRVKRQASADLSRKISVRIQATLRDVSRENDGVYRYEVASIVNSTSDIQLSGLDHEILAEGELVSSGLAVEVWTNRGRRGVVYSRTHEMTLYYRVNQAAWVGLIYVLQSGEPVPIVEAMYVDEAHVDRVITHPDTFEIVAPYGVEHIHATAFTSRPDPIVTLTRRIAGEQYQIVADGMNSIVATRAIKRRQSDQLAESFVTVTTTPS